jgi:hypothetical protein
MVQTLTVPHFKEFGDMYYVYNNKLGKRIKILPLDIEMLLTPIVLANLVMSDGNFHKTKHIFRLCTNCFTKQEVVLLSTALFNKFGIPSRIEHTKNEQYILVIRKTQVHILRNIVKPHIIPSLLYRIGL